MRLVDAHHFIDNCGSFVMGQLQKLSVPEDGGNLLEYAQVLKSVGRMFVDSINGVDSIQAEQDSANTSADCLVPPSMPCQLQFMSKIEISPSCCSSSVRDCFILGKAPRLVPLRNSLTT